MPGEAARIVAIEHVSIDGVYQAPARADEDRRNGFAHGGWSTAGDDPKMRDLIGAYMGKGWSLLVGRTTYEDLYEGWPRRQPDSPMTQALTGVRKYVVSRNGEYALPWRNSVLLAGEAADTVARLRQDHDRTLILFGSGVLVRTLMRHGLIDELVLMIHPIVLGAGFRLFDEAAGFARLTLSGETATDSGVVIATYRTAR